MGANNFKNTRVSRVSRVSPSRAFFLLLLFAPIYFLAPATQAIELLSTTYFHSPVSRMCNMRLQKKFAKEEKEMPFPHALTCEPL